MNVSGASRGVAGVIQVDQLSALGMLARKGRASGDVVPDPITHEVLANIATIAQ